MNDALLRTFKHDLRTPINHIIGYSELLLEEANDAGDSAAVSRLSAIHREGQGLFELVESTVQACTGEWNNSPHAQQLQAGSRPLVERILALSAPANGPEDDLLLKIGQAAERFSALVEKTISS
jgi:signal transduction histidine kinase